MAQLADLAVRSTAAFTTAALSCCSSLKAAPPAKTCTCGPSASARSTGSSASGASGASVAGRIVRSDPFPTTHTATQRQLTLETPLSTGYLFIPPERITFTPSAGRDPQQKPIGLLNPGESSFRIEVDATSVPGAVYFSTVRVRSADGSVDEPVGVFIEL
jgi:hypothetical protein